MAAPCVLLSERCLLVCSRSPEPRMTKAAELTSSQMRTDASCTMERLRLLIPDFSEGVTGTWSSAHDRFLLWRRALRFERLCSSLPVLFQNLRVSNDFLRCTDSTPKNDIRRRSQENGRALDRLTRRTAPQMGIPGCDRVNSWRVCFKRSFDAPRAVRSTDQT